MPLQATSTEIEHAQRVQVVLERTTLGQRVKIDVESHDAVLGWYTAGSLALPLDQLPILEQALEAMRRRVRDESYGQIIPFPRSE